MDTFEHNDAEQWKDKFHKSQSVIEEREEYYTTMMHQLRHAISRLSVIGDGVDPKLDEQLKTLRKQIHRDVDHQALNDLIENISATLLQFDDIKASRNQAITTQIKQLIEPMTSLQLPENLKEKVKSFKQKLDKEVSKENKDYGQFIKVYADIFDEFITAVHGGSIGFQKQSKLPKPTNLKPKKQEGFLDKLISKDDKSWLDEPIPFTILGHFKSLIDHLASPEIFSQRIQDIQQCLARGFTFFDLSSVVEQISQLVTDIYNYEQQRLEDYLEELNSRLHDVQTFLTSSSDGEKQSLENSARLEASIHREVNIIRESAKEARSVDTLVISLQDGLTEIVKSVDDFRKLEDERISASLEKIESLEEKLKETEHATNELHEDIVKQRQMAQRDSLTGLANRKAYDDRMLDAFARWRRYHESVSLIVCDIDSFKRINDNYGHLAGDKVLTVIGRMLNESVREVDFVARYGGEEFVMILEKTSVSAAKDIAEKIRKTIEGGQFHFRGEPVKITMSFGVTEFRDDDTPENIFGRADAALYEAKATGRNRIIAL